MEFAPILSALHHFMNVQVWLFLLFGVVIGLIVGILPGIGGMVAIAILLPFVFMAPPELAFTLIMSIWASQYLGGSITTILLNVPGEAANAATLFDGFPLSEKGEAGWALGAAQMAGLLAHIITIVVALLMIPFIIPLVMLLRIGDMVFIILIGLTFIATLSSESIIKGLISGCFGLIIGFIGYQPGTGVHRFTFGSLYLYDGVSLIPIMIGMFAIPEMVALATRGGSISRTQVAVTRLSDVFRGVKEVLRHKSLVARCQLIGFLVGIAPGAGASPAAFIAYAHAKQTSKHPETFGKGNVEGVIAPESANQACGAGDLLTTLALGIPGSPPMALLLGAMTMLGLIPGPEMITKNLDLSLMMLWSLAISAMIAALICFLSAPTLAKIAFLPGRLLVPLVLAVSMTGAFANRESAADLIAVVIFGALGLIMRRFGYNRPALILGFVLGGIFENYLFLALKVAGPLFFMRPFDLILILVIIMAVAYEPVMRARRRRRRLTA